MNRTVFIVLFIISYISLQGQKPVDYILKAEALSVKGNNIEAISLLTDGIELTKDYRLYIERAGLYVKVERYSDATDDYNKANSIVKSSGEYGLAQVCALQGDVTASMKHLEANVNSDFRKPEKEIMLDPVFEEVENSSEWRQFWKKDIYDNIEKGVAEIEYYVSSGKIDDANETLTSLMQNNGEKNDVLYAKALIDIATGHYSDAVFVLTGLEASTSIDKEKYLRVLAKSQFLASNSVGASTTYTKLINMDVPDSRLLLLRAECYRKTGETAKAMNDVKKFLDLYPEDKEALRLAGKLEIMSGDNLKALEYFSRNLKLHPNDPECFIDRANSYFMAKSWKLAMDDYSMSLDLDPENSEVWLSKGISLLKSGKKKDACHDFRMSFKLGNKKATSYISSNCIN